MSPGAPPGQHDFGVDLNLPAMPYKGLLPYSERDADLFFGRAIECDIVTANLLASRFTVLYGTSGVGKSSLLRAGVLYQLHASSQRNLAERGSPEFMAVLVSQWADDPVAAVLEGVRRSATEVLGEAAGEPDSPIPLWRALAWWTRRLGADLLLVLDQFEEYFLYHANEDSEGTFAVEFPRVVTRRDLRVSVLVSIREDAVTRLDRFKGHLPGLFDSILRVQHLDWEAARDAIEKPLEVFSRLEPAREPVTAEPELVEAVLNEVRVGRVTLGGSGHGSVDRAPDASLADQHVENPYLQLVMTRVWEEDVRAGSRTLRLATLRRLGGAEQIVRTHLDAAMSRLPVAEQDVAAGVFRYLVTPSGSKISQSERDLAEYGEFPEPDVTRVVRKLSKADARILRPVAPSQERPDEPRYEIFHDVLAPAILNWRARHVEARRAEARLASRLAAEVDAKRAAQDRARSYRRIALAMALVLAVVTTLAFLSWQGWRSTLRAQALSRSNELTEQALARLAVDPAASLRLAVAAIHKRYTPQAELMLRRALDESRVRVVMRGHQDWVTSATFSPDGKYVLTASNDRTVRVWEALTGKEQTLLPLTAAASSFSPPQFSHDGTRILVTGIDGTVSVWTWRSRRSLFTLPGSIFCATFNSDGDRIVTGDEQGRVRLWDADVGEPEKPSLQLETRVNTVAFDHRGRWVAAGDDHGNVVVLDRHKRRASKLAMPTRSGPVNQVAWNKEASKLVVASSDGFARVWDVGSNARKPEWTLPGSGKQDEAVSSASFASNEDIVLTLAGKTVRVWTGESRFAELRGHTAPVWHASFAPSGTQVITASSDGTARLWDGRAGSSLIELRGHSDVVFTGAFNHNRNFIVTAGADGTARVWDVTTGRPFGAYSEAVTAAALDGRATRVVTAIANGTAEVLNLSTGQPRRISAHRRLVSTAALSANGQLLVTAGDDGTVKVWDPQKPQHPLASKRFPDDLIVSVAFDHSEHGNRVILVRTYAGAADIWTWRSPRRKPIVLSPRPTTSKSPGIVSEIFSAVFSPDDKLVLTAHRDGTARLWDATNSSLVRQLHGQAGIVYAVAFSPDGTHVVTASGDGTARIWQTTTGRLVRTLTGQSSSLLSSTFSRDGRWVVAGDANGSTLVWDANSGQTLSILRRHVAPVNSALFTADGQILTASDDGTVKLYPCDTCGPLNDLLVMARERERFVR